MAYLESVLASYGRSVGQNGAVSSITAFQVPAVDSTYIVSASVLVTVATNHSFNVMATYTDEGNTSRNLNLNFVLVGNGALVNAVTNTNGTVPYIGMAHHIRCKASTSITILTTGTFTTVTYNVEGMIIKPANW